MHMSDVGRKRAQVREEKKISGGKGGRERKDERSTEGQLPPSDMPSAPDYSQRRHLKALREDVRVNFMCQCGRATKPRYLVK